MLDSVDVSINLPRSALSALRQEPDEFVREMRLAAAVKWYELEMISQSKAAEIAGVSRIEFLNALSRFGVTPFQIEVDELVHDVNNA